MIINKYFFNYLFISLGLLHCIGCMQAQKKSNAVNMPYVITSDLVRSEHYSKMHYFNGTVSTGNRTNVSFQFAGKIKKINVNDGDKVKAGQILASLDTSSLSIKLAEVKARISQINVELNLAKKSLRRGYRLKKNRYISEQEIEKLKSRQLGLEAEQKRLLLAKDNIQLQFERSHLLSPADGVIATRYHVETEIVNQGQAVFSLIEDKNPQAYVGVPIAIAEHFDINQNLLVTIRNKNYQANINAISTDVDPITHTVELRLSLPKNIKVFNGEMAAIRYQQQVVQAGFWVPLSALIDGYQGRWNIYVLNEDKQKNTHIARRDVEIIYTDQDQAYIRGAIKEEQQYVTDGLHKLAIGQQVVNTRTDY